MVNIKYRWIATFLIMCIYNPVNAQDEPVNTKIDKSRITQILSITQKHPQGVSMKKQSELFIQDLRKRLPNFSEEQLQVMKSAYEDAILEGKTAPYIKSGSENDSEYIEPDDVDTKSSPKENNTLERVRQHLKRNLKKTPVDEDTKTLKKEAERTIILLTVEKGDTLSDIAKRNYHDASMYIAIYEENKDQLASPNSVPEGIILRVPKIDSSNKEKFHKMVLEYEKKNTK